MLIRQDGERVIVISQPAHAALSGQLARAWGNERFGAVEPREDICLAAELHDIGWLDWEQTPTLNHETGLPHSFLQLPTRVHLGIWDHASRRALVFGRYPALLTSMHFTGLYEQYHDYARDSPDEARDARALVARELAFQEQMLATLRSDPSMASLAVPEIVERNRRLVALWDGMSLALCHGLSKSRAFTGVPAASGTIDITLKPAGNEVVAQPWPFAADQVPCRVEGRVVSGTFESEAAMRSSLADGPWVTVEITLRA